MDAIRTKPKNEPAKINSVDDLLKSFARTLAEVYLPVKDSHGNPLLARFLLDNGRFPNISDEIKPWNYRGWLVPYIQAAEAHPRVSKRYDYVSRTLYAGCLLDEPLPSIRFCGEFDPATKAGIKMLTACLEHVEYKSGTWNGMREFCEWLAFALGVITEPSKLDNGVQEFLYRNFNLEPLLLFPSDYLGQMLCETSHGKKNGFYPTPMVIVEMMARMTCGEPQDGIDRRAAPFADPAGCGTGRMLLYGSNYSMRLYGMDIDYLCVLITKINLALYAPWFYIPESFFGEQEKDESKFKEIAAEVEKADIETQTTENAATRPNALQSDAVGDDLPTGIETLRALKEKLDRQKNKNQKIYTTKIEQPELF